MNKKWEQNPSLKNGSSTKFKSRNLPNFVGRFYGWELIFDNPDTADFNLFAEHLVLARILSYE